MSRRKLYIIICGYYRPQILKFIRWSIGINKYFYEYYSLWEAKESFSSQFESLDGIINRFTGTDSKWFIRIINYKHNIGHSKNGAQTFTALTRSRAVANWTSNLLNWTYAEAEDLRTSLLNPFLPTVAFSQPSSNICCPRDWRLSA